MRRREFCRAFVAHRYARQPRLEVGNGFSLAMGQQRLLNYGEVAELLAVSTKTVQRLVARAELPVVRVAGAVRFDVDDVEDYVQRCRSARTDPRSAAAPRRVRGSAARVVTSHRPGSMVR